MDQEVIRVGLNLTEPEKINRKWGFIWGWELWLTAPERCSILVIYVVFLWIMDRTSDELVYGFLCSLRCGFYFMVIGCIQHFLFFSFLFSFALGIVGFRWTIELWWAKLAISSFCRKKKSYCWLFEVLYRPKIKPNFASQ